MVASGHFMAAQSDAERTFVKPWKWKKKHQNHFVKLGCPAKTNIFLLLSSFFLFNFWLFYVAFFRWYRQVPHPTKG
jgi:hypothetical protein